MANYRVFTASGVTDADDLLYATHPAPERTYVVYANKDGSTHRTVVVLWGVLEDGTAVPVTLSGVWDGVANRNSFVLHPDGLCSAYEECWDTLEEAVEAVRQRADD